jgi:hypothetical protein
VPDIHAAGLVPGWQSDRCRKLKRADVRVSAIRALPRHSCLPSDIRPKNPFALRQFRLGLKKMGRFVLPNFRSHAL